MELIASTVTDQWMNLSALGCLILCMVWGITKGLPSLVQSFRDECQAFRQDLSKQRDDFREELKQHRDQSRQLAETGHSAVNRLATSFEGLKAEFEKDRQPPMHTG